MSDDSSFGRELWWELNQQGTRGVTKVVGKRDAQFGSIMVGHRYWMPPPRQFQPMFQVLSTINCYATSSR